MVIFKPLLSAATPGFRALYVSFSLLSCGPKVNEYTYESLPEPRVPTNLVGPRPVSYRPCLLFPRIPLGLGDGTDDGDRLTTEERVSARISARVTD